jgi:hypothetical protein
MTDPDCAICFGSGRIHCGHAWCIGIPPCGDPCSCEAPPAEPRGLVVTVHKSIYPEMLPIVEQQAHAVLDGRSPGVEFVHRAQEWSGGIDADEFPDLLFLTVWGVPA